MKTRVAILGLGLGIVAGACADDAPSAPTWAKDVQPILLANCARCHSHPAGGGAPADFRLDRYDDLGIHARYQRGAFTMAKYAVERAVVREDMPPVGPHLSSTQKETLERWLEMGAPRGDGGAAPDMFIARETGELESGAQSWTVDEEWASHYRIVDEDRGVVDAQVFTVVDGAEVILGAGHEGFDRLSWDTRAVENGTYQLLARLFDATLEAGPKLVALGTVTVEHADGNVAPSVTIVAPGQDVIVRGDGELGLVMIVRDPGGGTLMRRVTAVRGDEEVELVADTVSASLGRVELPVDLADVPDGAGWRLRVSVTDAQMVTTVAESPPFIVSRATTDLTYADVEDIFDERCSACHPSEIDVDLSADSWSFWAGPVYRRVVLNREMPPPSAETLHGIVMTEEERGKVAAWILGGAPP